MEILQATENEFLRTKNLPSKFDIKPETENVSYSLDNIANAFYLLDETDLNNGDHCLYIMLRLLFIAMKVNKKSFFYRSNGLFSLTCFRSSHVAIRKK